MTRGELCPSALSPPAKTLGRGQGESPGLAAPPVLPQGRGLAAHGGAQRQLHHLEEKRAPSRAHSQQAQRLRGKGNQGSLVMSELQILHGGAVRVISGSHE